jgi:RNA 2',3'-cyclic 3'-phosphodiesterase
VPGRVFVAIGLPPAACALLADATTSFLRADPPWAREKPVAPQLLHVTLAFMGPVPDPAMPELVAGLRLAAAGTGPFSLRVSAVRPVPSPRRATMVWATLTGDTDAAEGLAAGLARAAGLPADSRPFSPHVTLVRARLPRRVLPDALAAAGAVLSAPGKETDGVVSVRSATVFSSTPGPGGPRYQPLATLMLGAVRG